MTSSVPKALAGCMIALAFTTAGQHSAWGQVTLPAPIAHWTFDEGINNYDLTTAIDSANGNNGAWQDEVSEGVPDLSGLGYTAGQIGGAVRMGGGANQYFLVDAIPQLDNLIATPESGAPVAGVGATWSAWIRIDEDSSQGYKGILVGRTVEDISDRTAANTTDLNQNWGLAWEVNGSPANSHIDSRVSGEGLDSPADSIMKGQWHHVALVWGNPVGEAAGNPVQRVYIDGALTADGPDSQDEFAYELVSSGSWLLGDDTCCDGREFDGLLDDLSIFRTALSTDQIDKLYTDGLAGVDAAGTATGMFVAGDTGTDGVDINDFNTILNNLGKDVTARNAGDLNGDRKVDLNDFQEWLEVAPAALHAEAFAALGVANTPEPSTLALLAMVMGGVGLSRRNR